MNAKFHETWANVCLETIVKLYELDSNPNLQEELLKNIWTLGITSLQATVNEDNVTIENAHGTRQQRNLLNIAIAAVQKLVFEDLPRGNIFMLFNSS